MEQTIAKEAFDRIWKELPEGWEKDVWDGGYTRVLRNPALKSSAVEDWHNTIIVARNFPPENPQNFDKRA